MNYEISLAQLIEILRGESSLIGPAKMQDILDRLVIPAEEIQGHTAFSDKKYARNLVCKTDRFEIMVMCWNAGQRSSIHDHAGSLGGLKILHGELTESLFEKAPNGMIKSLTSVDYRVGRYSGRGDIANPPNIEPPSRKWSSDLRAYLYASFGANECLFPGRSLREERFTAIL